MKRIPYILFIVFVLFINIKGIIMCFQASVVLGVGSLFLQGAGATETLVYWIGGYDIAEHLARALSL